MAFGNCWILKLGNCSQRGNQLTQYAHNVNIGGPVSDALVKCAQIARELLTLVFHVIRIDLEPRCCMPVNNAGFDDAHKVPQLLRAIQKLSYLLHIHTNSRARTDGPKFGRHSAHLYTSKFSLALLECARIGFGNVQQPGPARVAPLLAAKAMEPHVDLVAGIVNLWTGNTKELGGRRGNAGLNSGQTDREAE